MEYGLHNIYISKLKKKKKKKKKSKAKKHIQWC